MIRGINKHVIEINKVESPYFERAILFVKNEPDAAQREEYERCAQQVVRQLTIGYRRMPGARAWLAAARYLGCVAAGVAAALLFLH